MSMETFGDFIIAARQRRGMSARQLAHELDISPVYMCDFEKNRRPVTNAILKKLCKVLLLSEEETERMYDLAAISRNTVSQDLPEYIMSNELVRTALRTAKKHEIPDEKWERFIAQILKKSEE